MSFQKILKENMTIQNWGWTQWEIFLSNFQNPWSKDVGRKLKLGKLVNYNAVGRPAPATMGLVISVYTTNWVTTLTSCVSLQWILELTSMNQALKWIWVPIVLVFVLLILSLSDRPKVLWVNQLLYLLTQTSPRFVVKNSLVLQSGQNSTQSCYLVC